jgi:mRNA-degrading endonuclease RelE of RelBE toxin-antitoxin system
MESMKTEANPATPSAKEMRELVAALTPAERRTLKDPAFITEDEADLIMSDRAMREGREIPLEDVLKEFGVRPPVDGGRERLDSRTEIGGPAGSSPARTRTKAASELLQDLTEGPPDPETRTSIELRANPKVWRIRFHDNYRMIYQVSKAEKRIIVTRIKARSEAYKGMKH